MKYLYKEYDEQDVAHGIAVTQPLDVYYDDPAEASPDAREQAVDVITRFLIWVAEGNEVKLRGVRATVALYCLRISLTEPRSRKSPLWVTITYQRFGNGPRISVSP